MGLGVGAWIGGKEALRRFLWENPDYYLHDINFATDGALTREQVLTTANIIEGCNIFTVDLGTRGPPSSRCRRWRIAIGPADPAEPDQISITERHPVAWVAPPGR